MLECGIKMNVDQLKKQAFEQVMLLSKRKGYVSLDDILNCVEDLKLPIDEVDRLCEVLISNQVIFRDNAEDIDSIDNEEGEYTYDRSRLDYGSLYDKVIDIDPSLTEYVSELRLIPPPQRGEEVTLLYHGKDGNAYARNRLITMYLKVALRIALWHSEKYGLPLDETIQDANIGLILAFEKIPLASDKRFSTYAPWWIRQYINRATQGISKKYYIPVHIKDKLYDVVVIKRQHECDNCKRDRFCPRLVNEICEKLNIDQADIVNYLEILEEPLSIDNVLEQDCDEEVFYDNGEIMNDIIENVARSSLLQEFNALLTSLKDREAEVIKWRYGLIDGKEKTLEEVGRIFNLTRERIRQIEVKAINRLRHPSRSIKFKSKTI